MMIKINIPIRPNIAGRVHICERATFPGVGALPFLIVLVWLASRFSACVIDTTFRDQTYRNAQLNYRQPVNGTL